eukprot:6994553-Prymnesium_polylepis.2
MHIDAYAGSTRAGRRTVPTVHTGLHRAHPQSAPPLTSSSFCMHLVRARCALWAALTPPFTRRSCSQRIKQRTHG